MSETITHPKTRKYSKGQTKGPALEDILNDAAVVFFKSIAELKSEDRHEKIVIVRRVFVNACRLLTDAQDSEIAKVINKERSCVSYHISETKDREKVHDPFWGEYWSKYIRCSKLWNQFNKL